mgnify:FL=1
MIIEFKKMKLIEERRSVEIIGKIIEISKTLYKNKKAIITMSILQLAKIWGADKENVSDADNNFGSEKLENQCDETRELVNKFPDVKFGNKEIECQDNTIISDKDNNKIDLLGEDISGWENEGVLVRIPKEIYDKELDEKSFKLILTPTFIKVKEEREEK